jgi:hypothetical protein
VCMCVLPKHLHIQNVLLKNAIYTQEAEERVQIDHEF